MENSNNEFNDCKLDKFAVIGYIRQNESNLLIPPEIQRLCFIFYYDESYSTSMDDYQFEGRICRASFGDIYKAKCIIKHNKQIAIKIYEMEDISDSNESNEYQIIQNHISIMQHIDNQFIIKCLTSFTVKTEIWIVMPLLIGSIHFMMRSIKQFNDGFDDEYIISTVIYNILLALQYLHNDGRYGINTKCRNILISSSGICKLTDFGLSFKMMEIRRRGYSSSNNRDYLYMSPEILSMSGYDKKSDVWSVGITVLELAFGAPPHSKKKSPIKVMLSILQLEPSTVNSCNEEFEINKKYTNKLKDFLNKCLKKNQNDRKNVSELLKHSFIKQRKDGQYLVDKVLSKYDVNYGIKKDCIPESVAVNKLTKNDYDELP